MCIYICIYTYVCNSIYTYIYICICTHIYAYMLILYMLTH